VTDILGELIGHWCAPTDKGLSETLKVRRGSPKRADVLVLTDIFPSIGNAQTKTQQARIVGRDDGGIGIFLVGDCGPPGPDDGSRHVFASRVFTNGAGEDVSRNTLSVSARTIKADA
jgi:hypothetical protein